MIVKMGFFRIGVENCRGWSWYCEEITGEIRLKTQMVEFLVFTGEVDTSCCVGSKVKPQYIVPVKDDKIKNN